MRAAQLHLTYLGYAPRGVDGWFGEGTQKALVRFQIASGLAPSGALDDQTYAKLGSKALG
ncbi:MAG: peptidoglycan-binding domain-containing protein [Betaproteobacteria bacterium]